MYVSLSFLYGNSSLCLENGEICQLFSNLEAKYLTKNAKIYKTGAKYEKPTCIIDRKVPRIFLLTDLRGKSFRGNLVVFFAHRSTKCRLNLSWSCPHTCRSSLVWSRPPWRSRRLVYCCARDLRIACVSSATAIRQNSNWDLVCTIPLRWSLMCSSVAAMSISLDPLVMRLRTMSMSM